jgi:hypothetical protein
MAKTFEIATQKELTAAYVEMLSVIKKGRAIKCEVRSVATKTK